MLPNRRFQWHKRLKVCIFAAYSISILLKVPFSKEKQKLLNQAAAELERPNAAAEAKEMPFPCSYYVLKPDMMEKLGYPLLCKQEDGTLQLPEGFVSTTSRVLRGGLWQQLPP